MNHKAIWKYPLNLTDRIMLQMPEGAEVLAVQTQHGELCLWALVKPDAPKVDRYFRLFGTGHEMPVDMGVDWTKEDYRGTFQALGGDLVFHLFEVD
jgi:hypothetical protein